MYINAIGYYVPDQRISNDHFKDINGLDANWIYQRTGILTRSRATEEEKPRNKGGRPRGSKNKTK